MPWELVLGSPQFRRGVHGVRPPGGIYCHVAGCDLVRDADGSWRVLEDNCRTPSGISYVLENRLAMTRLAPELFTGYRVRRVDHYPQLLLSALREIAPAPGRDPTVVVGRPGRQQRVLRALVPRPPDGGRAGRGGDLVVRDDICYMRTTAGLARVDAIYRRLDDDFIDPLEFRPDRCSACRADPRLPGRHGGARQRGRHWRRRRQGGLRLRPRDDPLLPRRGAAARQRRRPTCCATPSSSSTCSTGSTRSWSSRPANREARASTSARGRPTRRPPASARYGRRRSAGSPRSWCRCPRRRP